MTVWMMQLETGLRQRGIDGGVVHVIELLDEAMRTTADSEERAPTP
jgi:hypothetical protein